MGGREAVRGFLYQGFASVLEAVSRDDWEEICVEVDSPEDKVDIGLRTNGVITTSIQVKSTMNSFSKNKISQWLEELLKDEIGASEIGLFLIGQCDKNAVIFMNSIKKFCTQQNDKTVENALKDFNTDLLCEKNVKFRILPFDIEILQSVVRDSLHKYTSKTERKMTFEQIKCVAAAMVHEQMLYSTDGIWVSREEFNEKLEEGISLTAAKENPQRESIHIISIKQGNRNVEPDKNTLFLLDKFDDKHLKTGYNWNKDILKHLQDFLDSFPSSEQAYQIYLDTHISIAFAAGRILNSKSGYHVFPMQKTNTSGVVLWNVEESSKQEYSKWEIECDKTEENTCDVALVLSIAVKDIYEDVKEYIEKAELQIGKIIACSLNTEVSNKISIKDGTHAFELADSLSDVIAKRSSDEKKAVLHIFAAAPNGFMFFLGKVAEGFGKCILYEFDFKRTHDSSYTPAIKFME
jgi:hypothetical protein